MTISPPSLRVKLNVYNLDSRPSTTGHPLAFPSAPLALPFIDKHKPSVGPLPLCELCPWPETCALAQILHSSWDAMCSVKSISTIPAVSHLCLFSVLTDLISGCLLTLASSTSQPKCLGKVCLLNGKQHVGKTFLSVIFALSPSALRVTNNVHIVGI